MAEYNTHSRGKGLAGIGAFVRHFEEDFNKLCV